MIIRAFLSHGHGDKLLVQKVAEYLGRAAVVFDVFEFSTGDDLKSAIIKSLSKSDIFVLFASTNSLKRDWVKFEIAEAEKTHAVGALRRTLTYIVDSNLSVDAIPDWMKATLITRQDSPALIAKDIRRVINERLAESRPTFFVGRSEESQDALEIITSFPDPEHRPPLIVYGLNGIGRRSLVRDIARNNLSYPKTLEIQLREGDLLPELLLKTTAALASKEIGNPSEFIKHHATRDIRSLAADIVDTFLSVCAGSTLPVIFDQGAISTEERVLRADFDLLYNTIAAEPRADCIIITNRRVHASTGGSLPAVRVSELSSSATQKLVRLLAADRRVQLSANSWESIAEYSRGYPPSVAFAIGEAEVYGVDHVVSNQRALVNFSAEIFLEQLSADKKITKPMESILQLLSNYSPLPLSVIQKFLGTPSPEELANVVSYLMDFAFVLPEGSHYRISEPVRDAAYRAFGGFKLDHQLVGSLIERFLQESGDDEARITLAQSLFRATLLGGAGKPSALALGLASDLVQLTTQSYHDQEYENVLRFGSEAVALRPDSVNVRRYVAQALIRKEKYLEAEVHINAMIENGHLGEAFYVKGFMSRRRHLYEDAIENYLKSIEYGRGGPAIHRELASCYFERGNMPRAQEHITIALKASSLNRFVVDLQCTIAIRTGNLPDAEKALAILERVDPGGFYQHRRSTYEQAKGHAGEALKYAERAVENLPRPTFEVLANLANCQIEMNRLVEAAKTIHDLHTRFPSTQHDSKTGLRCKLEIRRGDIDIAETLWKQIREKETGVHRGLRLALLSRKAQAQPLSKEELAEQKELLGTIADADWKRSERLLGSVISSEE